MPDGFQTRLIVVLLAILGALYVLTPTILDITCSNWEFGCLPTGEEVAEATTPTPVPTATSAASLEDPDPDATVEDTPVLVGDTPTPETTATEAATQTEAAATPEETPPATETPTSTPIAVDDDDDDKDKRPLWVRFLPSRKLRLGLDLVGGIHVVLDVQTNDALQLTAEKARRQIIEQLEEEKIAFDTVRREPEQATLKITLPTRDDLAKVDELIRKKISSDLARDATETIDGKSVVTYSYTENRVAELSNDAVERVLEILRSRVDEFGVAEPLIYKERGTRIVVQLPGLTDQETAIRTIKRTARLEFRIVSEDWYKRRGSDGAAQAYLQKVTDDALKQHGQKASDEVINRYARDNKLIPENTQIFYEKTFDRLEKQTVRTGIWLCSQEIGMLGDRLEDAGVTTDRFGKPAVSFTNTPEGSVEFGALTEENRGRRLAVILEGQLRSAPVIKDKITRNGQITLGQVGDPGAQYKEANEIAQVLRSGALPATVSIEQNWTVGSTLGEDSIRQGRRALLFGGALVLFFMALWYRLSGLLADVTVLLAGLLLFALMVVGGFTLSLPGIAGVVLTVGMAVDANVLIYERIREELRLGKIPRAAVDAGFDKAFSTIMDANLTTAAAGFVLYYFGTGPIQGFALTLLCGIACTLFGSLVITRLFFEYWVYGRRAEKISI